MSSEIRLVECLVTQAAGLGTCFEYFSYLDVQAEMSYRMALDINRDDEPTGESPPSSRAGEVTGDPVTPIGHRDAYRNTRKQLLSDFTTTIGEAMDLEALLLDYVEVSRFPETFGFRDALSYVSTPDTELIPSAVEKFKLILSQKIKERAARAEQCETPEERASNMRDVEHTFLEKSDDVIDDTRLRCVQLIEDLCSRLESVASVLESDCNGSFNDAVDYLRLRARSLSRYASSYLGPPREQEEEGRRMRAFTKSPATIEVASRAGNGPSLVLSLKDFFERLKHVTSDLANALNEQSAA